MHEVDWSAIPRVIPCRLFSPPPDPELVFRDAWRSSGRCHGTPATPSIVSPPITKPIANPVDFSDPESQRVLTVAARAVARELGREAAREYFDELVSIPRSAE